MVSLCEHGDEHSVSIKARPCFSTCLACPTTFLILTNAYNKLTYYLCPISTHQFRRLVLPSHASRLSPCPWNTNTKQAFCSNQFLTLQTEGPKKNCQKVPVIKETSIVKLCNYTNTTEHPQLAGEGLIFWAT